MGNVKYKQEDAGNTDKTCYSAGVEFAAQLNLTLPPSF